MPDGSIYLEKLFAQKEKDNLGEAFIEDVKKNLSSERE